VGKGVAQKPLAPTRVYTLVPREPKGGSKVVIGTAPILGFKASVLFDSGATLLFRIYSIRKVVWTCCENLEPGLAITTPIGKTMVCKHVVCECPVSIY
jgi:hypothetical protein